MDNCPICNKFIYSNKNHTCSDKWQVLVSYEDGWSELSDPSLVSEYTIYTLNAQAAAEEAAAEDERSGIDYSVAEGTATAHVKVTCLTNYQDDDKPQYFTVTGYISPEYEANETHPTIKQLTPPENTSND